MKADLNLPWAVIPCDYDPYGDIGIHSADGRRFARLWLDDAPVEDYNDDQQARAAYITKACNAHDDLVAALKGMLDRYPNNFGDEQPKTGACHHYAETCRSCEGLVTAWKADRAARTALRLAGAA